MSIFLKATLVIGMWFGQINPLYQAKESNIRAEACPGSLHTRYAVKGTPLGISCKLYKEKRAARDGVGS